jgi:hypothetical protein
MGIVHKGIPRRLARQLRQRHGLSVFIETGTHMGNTAVWAAGEFVEVITIESSPHYHQLADEKFSLPNVRALLGNSWEILQRLEIDAPALFWLDAHWSPDLEGERPVVICPVLDELAVINESTLSHAILIDDARLFGNTPGWPKLDDVKRMAQMNGRKVWIEEDVIFAVPGR